MGVPEEVPTTDVPPAATVPLAIIQPLEIEVSSTRPPRTKLRLYAILFALYVRTSHKTLPLIQANNIPQLCTFIAALDQTILSTSIPTIATQLHAASGYAWIASAYFLTDAAASPVWAKFSDIWGRKLALLASVVIFAASSIMAATSKSVRVLIAARALQGIGGAGLCQLSLITISDLFSMRQRTIFLGLVNVCWGK